MDNEQQAWDMYFCSIVAMQEHPGFNREGAKPKSLAECRRTADLMLHMRKISSDERRERKCRGLQALSSEAG